MKTKHRYLLTLFWLALFADCYLIYSHHEHLRWVTKPALMPLLLLYYFFNTYKRSHIPSKLLTVIALLLAWCGDILLLNKGEVFFISGLVLFLFMHLIYIIYFARVHPVFPVTKGLYLFLPLMVVTIFDMLVMRQILPYAGELGNPMIAYMIVISFMFIVAVNILSNKTVQSLAIRFFIPGAAMFLLSDAILGLNMFLWEDHLIGIVVMLTYGYAQFLIVHGFIKHVRGRAASKAQTSSF